MGPIIGSFAAGAFLGALVTWIVAGQIVRRIVGPPKLEFSSGGFHAWDPATRGQVIPFARNVRRREAQRRRAVRALLIGLALAAIAVGVGLALRSRARVGALAVTAAAVPRRSRYSCACCGGTPDGKGPFCAACSTPTRSEKGTRFPGCVPGLKVYSDGCPRWLAQQAAELPAPEPTSPTEQAIDAITSAPPPSSAVPQFEEARKAIEKLRAAVAVKGSDEDEPEARPRASGRRAARKTPFNSKPSWGIGWPSAPRAPSSSDGLRSVPPEEEIARRHEEQQRRETQREETRRRMGPTPCNPVARIGGPLFLG